MEWNWRILQEWLVSNLASSRLAKWLCFKWNYWENFFTKRPSGRTSCAKRPRLWTSLVHIVGQQTLFTPQSEKNHRFLSFKPYTSKAKGMFVLSLRSWLVQVVELWSRWSRFRRTTRESGPPTSSYKTTLPMLTHPLVRRDVRLEIRHPPTLLPFLTVEEGWVVWIVSSSSEPFTSRDEKEKVRHFSYKSWKKEKKVVIKKRRFFIFRNIRRKRRRMDSIGLDGVDCREIDSKSAGRQNAMEKTKTIRNDAKRLFIILSIKVHEKWTSLN